MFDLTGMTALVTGASGGIGSAIAQALSAQGARLAVSGSNADKLNAFRDTLGGDHVALPCNLGDAAAVYARAGFNLIATANIRDRGVNEMSAALKRRFAFETVFPIASLDEELALVEREAARLLAESGVPAAPPREVLEVLVASFRELRAGVDLDGAGMERLSTVLSTAEAVSVACAVGLRGHYLRGDTGEPADIAEALAGTAVKDDPDDLKKLRRYLDQRVAKRNGAMWRALYEARHRLPG